MRDKYKTVSIRPILDKLSSIQKPVLDAKVLQDAIKQLEMWVINATRAREIDLQDFNNQVSRNPLIFTAPSSSTSLNSTEKVGDIAADASYFYVVVDNAGALEWRRVAISSF